VKSLIGTLPEEVNTYERLTGAELLEFTGRMHGIDRATTRARATELLDLMQMSDDRDRMLVDNSMGMRKKTLLACALIHGPRVLFLDEPFNGIDAITTQVLRGVLADLAEKGVTIVFSSHVLEVVQRLCTRFAIIDAGRLVATGTLAQLRVHGGFADDASLEDVFVSLMGGASRQGDLSWIH
jgi:ABC-2 type transport system ATP-binding protein